MSANTENFGSRAVAALQTFQPAIMPTVAIIPLGGLLMGIGTFLLNATFVEMYPILGTAFVSTLASILRDTGQMILNNIGFMFAISIAMVYSQYDGFAGLSAGVSYLAFMKAMGTVLGITADTVAENRMTQTTVLGIPTLNTGVMGGIAVGLLVAWCYKKFHEVKLPTAFAFFQGKRAVPIMSILLSDVLACAFSIVWPLVQSGIQGMGSAASGENLFVVSTMLFFSRLLLPFGLHTLISMPIMYDMGTYVMSDGTIVHGATNIYMSQLADGGNWSDFSFFSVGTSVFSTTFMIAVALAIIASSRPEYRKKTVGLFSAGIFTAALTGISEPIMFSYLFVCPPLFALHCLFHGYSPIFAKLSDMHVGTGFCGGLMDFIVYGILQGNEVSHWMRGFIFVPLFGGLCFVTCYLFIKVFHLHVPGNREGDFADEDDQTDSDGVAATDAGGYELAARIIDGLKGRDNILTVDSCATRLRVTVKDASGIMSDSFNSMGASGTLVAGNSLQIIFGLDAPRIKEQVKAALSGSAVAEPAGVIAEEIVAPAKGTVIPLGQVKDAAISSGMIGRGFAVEPLEGTVVSPVNGTVVSIFPTKHAIVLRTDTGREVLVHMGIDTVSLSGKPFQVLVSADELVSTGQPLATMDLAMVKEAGYETSVCVLFTDLEGEDVVLKKSGPVGVGEADIAQFASA